MRNFHVPNGDIERAGMLQAGLDLLDQGLTVFDADLRLVAWNEPFLRLLAFPKAMAYVGATFESFIRHNAELGEYGPGDANAQVELRVAAAARFAPHTTERVRPNGRILQMRGEPLPDSGFVTLYTDITAQRQIEGSIQNQQAQLEERVLLRTAELESANASLSLANDENVRIAAALGRSEARLRLINDNMPVLIGYVDKNENYQYANKGYSDWFDIPPDEVLGRSIPEVIGEDIYSQIKEDVRQALCGQQRTYEYHMERQGRTVFARTTLVPEMSLDHETLGFFALSQDITEQKQLQADLLQAQKMEAVGQLTGGLAHDFNNLLTVIIGTLVTLQEHRLKPDEIDEFVTPALQSARRGAQLIKRLLTFSRQQALEPLSIDIGQLIKDTSALVRRALPESIAVETDLPLDALHCLVDPGQLESALLNFVVNASDAMPDGGRLRICARRVLLTTDAAAFEVAPGAYAMIEAIDDGCGMDGDTLARACEPFFTTKRFGLGSGLGLSMAYGLVKQSGGGIAIHSQVGHGTTVQLVLPLALPPSALELDLEPDTALSHADELVLLVDDERNVRRVVRQQLIDLGYPVIEAEDAEQARDMLAHIPDIAIVLSDIILSGATNGHQLGAHIRANHPTIRILLMSGYSGNTGGNTGGNSSDASDLPLLAKPFIRQDLARALLASRQEKS
jgi:PAS domain S-box-containing protein